MATVTIYGDNPSGGYVPSGVKLPSMVAAAVTIDGPCPNCSNRTKVGNIFSVKYNYFFVNNTLATLFASPAHFQHFLQSKFPL